MATIKQYVNLPTGVTNINGPVRDLKLQPNTIPNVAAGDRVEWWVEPVGANNTDEQYLSLPSRANMQHSETVINAGSGFFENQLNLPHVGGDKYVVKAAKKNDRPNSVSSDTFETWRKVYYTVFHVGNNSLNFFNNLEADFIDAFKPGFIELENAGKIAALTVQARVDASINRVGGLSFPFMDGSADAVMDLQPDGSGSLTNKPYNVALLVCPDILKTTPVPANGTFSNPVGTTNYGHLLYTEVGKPRAFLTQGDIRWTGHPWTAVQPNFNLVSTSSVNSVVNWDFSAVPGLTTHLAAAPGNTYDLRWTVLKESPIMGYSLFNFCIVRTLDGTTEVLQTFTHEVGHGIGQAVQWENRWNAAGASISPEANPKWYDDVYGGRGPHCSTNAVLVPGPANLTSGQTYRHGGGGKLCTMYHAGSRHVEPKGKFCAAHCEPRIKRRKLDTAAMNAKFWNYFG